MLVSAIYLVKFNSAALSYRDFRKYDKHQICFRMNGIVSMVLTSFVFIKFHCSSLNFELSFMLYIRPCPMFSMDGQHSNMAYTLLARSR